MATRLASTYRSIVLRSTVTSRRSLTPATTLFRTMASSTSGGRNYEWLVVVPDFPGVLQKRLEVREQHFANLKKAVEEGDWKMGGALLSEVPADDQPSSLKFVGSTLVVTAATKDEIIDMLKKDIYVQKGVWDLENVQMWPLKTAFRKP